MAGSKICWVFLSAFAAFVPRGHCEQGQTVAEGVVKLDYRSWPDSYKLFNSQAQVVIVPRVGARLSVFSLNGINPLLEDFLIDGFALDMLGVYPRDAGTEWIDWDGCQPDLVSPSGAHQLQPLWVSPYRVAETGPRTAAFQSGASSVHTAQVRKRFTLDKEKPLLSFEYAVTNKARETRKWACYHRIMCKTPCFVIFPLRKGSRFKSGYRLETYDEGAEGKDAIRDESMRLHDGVMTIGPQYLKSAGNAKVISDSDAGWVAWVWNRVVLLVRYPHDPGWKFRDNETMSVYWEMDKAVLEPWGPCVALKRGESADLDTTWTLAEIPEKVHRFEDVRAALGTIKGLAGR